ncbi:MAG: hypothetical protein ACUVXA_15935 [Candidatus Jordarchaeum sp.]|uniref:hypothetical protein n=1 Tax=Candidatus Jordarchaeum sp. TaxID=2823881 RepID=UPI004049C56B
MRKLLFLNIVIIFLFGCTTYITKPNRSYLYNIPSINQELPKIDKEQIIIRKNSLSAVEIRVHSLFEKFYKINPNLAFEVGKLPEFQDEIS